MKVQAYRAGQLLALIPKALYQELTDELAADKWVPKMKAEFLFKLLVFGILQTEDLSLRVLQEFSRSPVLFGLAPDLFEPVTYGTIRARLINVKVEFFARLYEHLYDQLAAQFPPPRKQKYRLKRYDSTLVATFAHLLDAMKVGNSSKNKRQVKFTAELTDRFLVNVAVFSDQAHLSEHRALKDVIEGATHTPREVVVFDRGLSCRKTLTGFCQTKTKFITRGKHNCRYRLLQVLTPPEQLPVSESLELRADLLVHLYGDGGREVEQEFRLIQARRRSDGKELVFLTNVMDLPADEVAQLYRQRWEIEVLFKFMKQEMNLSHFVCHDANAIEVMIYCTLIASMLVLAYKHSNGIASFKLAKIRFFKELHLEMLEQLLENRNGLAWVKKLIKFSRAQRK